MPQTSLAQSQDESLAFESAENSIMTADIFLSRICLLMILGMHSDIIILAVSSCDPKTQYTVRNMTSGEFKSCKDVHDCRPNKQPDFPAGSDIDITQSVGHCHPCGKGTYSPGGIEQCKKCQYTKCFAHQVIEGMCPDERNHDSSFCMEKCEKGYIMNSARSACELVEITNTTSNATIDPTSIPTSNKATSTPTINPTPTPKTTLFPRSPPTKPTSNLTATLTTRNPPTTPTFDPTITPPTGNPPTRPIVAPKHSMSTDKIVGVVFGVLFSVGLIAVMVYCCRKRSGARDHMVIAYHQQRSFKADIERGESESFISPDNLNTSSRELIITNQSLVENDDVELPREVSHEARRQAQIPQLVDLSPTDAVPIFGNMPFNLWLKIEETFERNAGAVTWKDLAAWFGLTVNDVNRIEHMDSKTRTVIHTWVSKTGSGLPQFENILRENKMVGLADAIKTWMQSLSSD